MSEIKTLRGFHIGVEHEKQPEAPAGEENGGVEMVDIWTLVLTEVSPPTNNQYRIGFRRDARDEIVRALTGGVVLAGGDLPNLGGPR
jgi:hypothetical protein